MKRLSGIILHPTSLPNNEGVGTIGKEAFAFIDWLKTTRTGIWQMLPIGPTGYGDSPYASFSAFAGNPYLISLEALYEKGFLQDKDFNEYKKTVQENTNPERVDFGLIHYHKTRMLKKAAAFLSQKTKTDSSLKEELEKFYQEESFWLEGYAAFMTIKEDYEDRANKENLPQGIWSGAWPKPLALNKEKPVQEFLNEHSEEYEIQKIIQFFFFSQWKKLKEYAEENGIQLVGDIPIFAAMDSADVWQNQKLFLLDKEAKPKAVAGVPPDFFSPTGQLWGNPLYDWAKMKKDGYLWWKSRIRHTLKLFDIIRLDHFRGFEAFWAIPQGAQTAQEGKWVKGPDHHFFEEVQKDLISLDEKYRAELPILSEDLGVITPEVARLRDDFHFPTMKILQFAFDLNELKGEKLTNPYLPHNHKKNCAVYTGSHDNDTIMGWLEGSSEEMLKFIYTYLYGKKVDERICSILQTFEFKKELASEIIRTTFSSVADFAGVQMQDLLFLNSEARMNAPSTLGTNWQWRLTDGYENCDMTEKLQLWNVLYNRD
ncbi:4-alpha-glucanotransferase [Treponema sp. OMZ 787]|uniref:4-alpha-glucanotransferase n=1 Tax=Treponema sp. OMZ 787 TaxID=2563669 RepID=UPI0020A50A74|nr:4-alpha-glucanotransferase [Treponema sp. OMZ 787]UTC63213.1 4-alpha-glucanotransferase [Treponema sp. OMZ 787]